MVVHPKEFKTKTTPKGEHIIAFSVSEADYRIFLEHYKKDKQYVVKVDRWFDGKTDSQRACVYGMIRALATEIEWNFDRTKHFVLTEDGFERTSTINGIDIPDKIFIEKEYLPSIDEIEKFIVQAASQKKKERRIYLRYCRTTDTHHEFLVFKGISEFNTKEMKTLITRLIDRCAEYGIAPPSEYMRIKNGEEKH